MTNVKVTKIVIKTFAVGYTFTLCDSYYGIIENKSYKQQIENQQQWIDLMKTCNINANEIPQEMFYNWDFLDKMFRKNK